MFRNIVKIDSDKCNGCGLCVDACHEGALKMINGKAVLVSDSYCDGLGDCLPECPTGAISIEKRDASNYVVDLDKKETASGCNSVQGGCPGSANKTIIRTQQTETATIQNTSEAPKAKSQLQQWPVQIKLVAPNAPFFDGASILVAADCTAFAYANLHEDFIKGRVTLIGCPKLDAIDYSEKLTEILKLHDIKNITVLKMEVPCCNGIAGAVQTALMNSGKIIPWRLITVTTDGQLKE